MVMRGPGAVGCAHCTKIGADRSCQVCTRLVCEACGSDWATCDQPSGRVLRLGLTARVRDIDPVGRFALVSHWRRPLRVLDLRALRWDQDSVLARGIFMRTRAFPPRLTADGRVVYFDLGMNIDERIEADLCEHVIASGRENVLAHDIVHPVHGTAISATHDWYSYITDSQQVVVIGARDNPLFLEPLPRKVVQAAQLDADRRLLVSASWSELAVHAIDDATLHLVGHTKTGVDGNIAWVGLAGGWVAAAIRHGGGTTIEARRLEEPTGGRGYTLGKLERTLTVPAPFGAAAIARDGRYLAIGSSASVVVLDLNADSVQTFDDHTDQVNCVRFASDDHVLISADTDNRVVLRPRTATGYARPVIPVEVGA